MKNRVLSIVVLAGVLGFTGCQAVRQAVEAINRYVTLNVGPATEQWPVQPVDDATKVLLDVGRRTAERRSSLEIVATGSLVDSYGGGRNCRAVVRWKKPEMLRIDFEGEPENAGGKRVKWTFLRPSTVEWRYYDEIEKSLKIVDWRNADEAAQKLNLFRIDPLPWFFRDKTDVARRRNRLELIDSDEQGLLFDLKPANDEWGHSGEIVLDPRTGMPVRMTLNRFTDFQNGTKKQLIVESIEENPMLGDDLFEAWTPKPDDGWTIVRQDMGVKNDADAVLAKTPERNVAMTIRGK